MFHSFACCLSSVCHSVEMDLSSSSHPDRAYPLLSENMALRLCLYKEIIFVSVCVSVQLDFEITESRGHLLVNFLCPGLSMVPGIEWN
jgi:hypothetical protein